MSDRFEIVPTTLDGVLVLKRRRRGDERGYLERMYCTEELSDLLGGRSVMQINHTLTVDAGTVRGMHYQLAPHAETKIVSCVRGKVYDVAVDLRPHSPTFLRWHAEVLSPETHTALVIPEGCAHGFQTLVPDCQMLYFHTAHFNAESERGVDAADARLAIEWPLPFSVRSPRDSSHPSISAMFGEYLS
jgi:dTDP-4-dehydrorhamnose 3,5-epimerase